MPVSEPLAVLAAILALSCVGLWWQVANVANAHGSEPARVNRKLYLAAIGTAVVLALAGLSIIAPVFAGLFI